MVTVFSCRFLFILRGVIAALVLAAALDARGLENVVALTKMTGYVRYFHPSDAAASTDWDAFTAAAMPEVEKARDARELQATLDRLFAPLIDRSPPGHVSRVVSWHHRGVKTNPRNPSDAWRSERRYGWHLSWAVRVGVAVALLVLAGWVAGLLGSWVAGPLRRVAAVVLALLALVPLLWREKAAKEYVAEVAPGVTVRVPLTCYGARSAGVPPAPGAGRRPVLLDRAMRLANVASVWNVTQHFYPYFDVVKVDWEAALRRALRKAATDTTDAEFLDTLRMLGHDLRDSHAWVTQFRAPRMQRLPVTFAWAEEQLVVSVVAEGVTSVRRGDIVTAIDGVPVREVIAARARTVPCAHEAACHALAIYFLGSGPQGSAATLTLAGRAQGAGGRAQEPMPTPAPSALPPAPSGRTVTLPYGKPRFPPPPLGKIADLAPGVVYVDLSWISLQEFRAALPRLEKAKGIVFALRTYPNAFPDPLMIQHLMDEPFLFSQHQSPIVTMPDRRDLRFDADRETKLEPLRPRLRAKVAFVTTGIAVSYAEHVLDAVQHYKLGAVVGETTSGSFGSVNELRLPGGYSFNWTATRSQRLDGSTLHGIGIQPDIYVPRTIRGIREGRHEAVERAVEYVLEQGAGRRAQGAGG